MWLSDFRVVLADRVLPKGSVRLEGGLIAEVADHPVNGAAVEGGGLLLLPGFIDMHGDMIEREVEPRPGVRMPMELGLRDLDRRLAAAGITTAYAALSFSPGSTYGHLRSYDHTSAVIRALKAMTGELRIEHRVHARFEVTFPDALGVIEALLREGAVDLVSLMDHTPGQGQYRDLEALVVRTAEEKRLDREAAEAAVQARVDMRRQPAEVMAATLRAISDLCGKAGVPLASHDDDTAAKVALMVGLGCAISEFPVTLNAAVAARAAGLRTAMGAPNALRGASSSGNLLAREAYTAGLLDMLASDYHPSAMLPAVLALAGAERLGEAAGLAGAVRLVSQAPALALGLGDRGTIAPGMRGDLVVADDQGLGHVRATWRGGAVVFSDGTLGRV